MDNTREKISLEDFTIDNNRRQIIHNEEIEVISIPQLGLISDPSMLKKELVFSNCVFNSNFNFDLNYQPIKDFRIEFINCDLSEIIFNIDESAFDENNSLTITITKCTGLKIHVDSQQQIDINFYSSYFSNYNFYGKFNSVSFYNTLGNVAAYINPYFNSKFYFQSRINSIPNINDQSFELQNRIHKNKFLQSVNVNSQYKILVKNFREVIFYNDDFYSSLNATELHQNLDINISSTAKAQRIVLHNFHFRKIKLGRIELNEQIIFKDVSFTDLIIRDVTTENMLLDNVFPNSIDPDSSFIFSNFDFKSGYLRFLNLSEVKNVIFDNFNIENKTIISSKFPEKIFFSLNNVEEHIHIQTTYEFYRQLKTAFLRNNNTLQALEAHSKMYEYAMKRKDLDEWDRFILKMNHWSNRHGTSIGHALKTIFLIAFGSFLLLIFSSRGNSNYCVSEWFVKNIFDKSTLLFSILNPLSRTEEFKDILTANLTADKSLSFFQYLIIFLTKIGIGWGYYQFIAAFRKFGKNG